MKKLAIIFSLFVFFFIARPVWGQEECFPEPSVSCIEDAKKESNEQGTLQLDATATYTVGVNAAALGSTFIAPPLSDGSFSQRSVDISLIGKVVKGVHYAYTAPPASLAVWINDTGQSLGFIPKQTYAQGTGFSALTPILNVWKVFRNVSYVLVSIVLVFIGFMIMFRKKIDPHTVVTIQNALPRIIITLIAITFSYAIAALLLELMYLVMFIAINIISTAFGQNTQELINTYTGSGFGQGDAFALLGRMMAPLSAVEGSGGLVGGGIGAIVGAVAGGGVLSIPGAILGGLAGLVVSGFVSLFSSGGSPVGFISPILWLIFAIVIFFFWFRILFMLISSYVQILISIITSPLLLLMNVIPGNNSFQGWVMSLIGNLGTFVIVAIMLMLNGAIVSNIMGNGIMWAPPLVGGVDSNLLKMIVGVGGVILIPNVVKSFKEMIKAGQELPVGQAAAGSVGSGVGALFGTVQTFASLDHLSGGKLREKIPFLKSDHQK